jgi:hypothetical protein
MQYKAIAGLRLSPTLLCAAAREYSFRRTGRISFLRPAATQLWMPSAHGVFSQNERANFSSQLQGPGGWRVCIPRIPSQQNGRGHAIPVAFDAPGQHFPLLQQQNMQTD